MTRPAPLGPEIDEHRRLVRPSDHDVLEARLGRVHRHRSSPVVDDVGGATGDQGRLDVLGQHARQRSVPEIDFDRRPSRRAAVRARPRPSRSRAAPPSRGCRAGQPGGARSPRARGAPRVDRSACSSQSRCRAGSSARARRRRGGSRRPDPIRSWGRRRCAPPRRRAGRARRRLHAWRERSSCGRSGSRCQRVARSGGSRAPRGTPGSRAAARRRGCAAAAPRSRRSRRSPRASRGSRHGRSGGQHPPRCRHCGATRPRRDRRRPRADACARDPRARRRRGAARSRSLRRRPPRPPQMPRQRRGSGTRPRPCTRPRRISRYTSTYFFRTDSGVAWSASSSMPSRHVQKSVPAARPRNARWKA